MPRLQVSFAFSQRDWPGAGDVDDCWCIADLAMIHCVAPWLRLVGIPVYREAAGVPDRPAKPDGGQLVDSITAIRKLWPDYAEHVHRIIGGTWSELTTALLRGRPVSVSIVSGELPVRLRFGFAGYHRVTIVRRPSDGQLLMMNPLQDPYDRWLEVSAADVRDAILAYGKAKRGARSVYALTGPTLVEALEVYAPAPVPVPVPPAGGHTDAELAAAYDGGLAAAGLAVAAVPRKG